MAQAPLVLDAHGKHAQAVHFTRDGKRLVSVGQDARVRLWSVPGFKAERAFEGHEKSVHSLSFRADEKHLLTASSDPAVKLWSFPEGKCLFTLERQVHGALGPDGAHAVTISAKGELTLWDGETGQKRKALAPLDKRHMALCFAPSGLFFFVGGTGRSTACRCRTRCSTGSTRATRSASPACGRRPTRRSWPRPGWTARCASGPS
jgi:WD40 repeat protein